MKSIKSTVELNILCLKYNETLILDENSKDLFRYIQNEVDGILIDVIKTSIDTNIIPRLNSEIGIYRD